MSQPGPWRPAVGARLARTLGLATHTSACSPPINSKTQLMFRVITAISLLVGLFASTTSIAASAIHKCESNGKVTFQSGPCATAEQAPRPTVEQLNAERKKRAASAASAPKAEVPNVVGRTNPGASPGLQPGSKSGFRCDGRKVCSQMTSCAEAKYFLANCPGVKMDGDGNGIPCERQWCSP